MKVIYMTKQKFSSPKGVAVYPRLTTPDTKFDELGTYKADIAVPVEEAKGFMDQMRKIAKAHTGKAVPAKNNTMWTYEEDKETGEETGRVIFKFRVKNKQLKDGSTWDRKPVQYDAKRNKIDVNPWGGTVMKVAGEVYCWTAGAKTGVSLQPSAVQVIDLVEGSESASDFGFDDEDGFEQETAANDVPFDDQEEAAADDEY